MRDILDDLKVTSYFTYDELACPVKIIVTLKSKSYIK